MQKDEYARMRAFEDHYWWFVSRRRMAMRLLKRHGDSIDKVLDVGCGTGAMLQELQANWPESEGLDFSELALELAGERGLKGLHLGSAEEMPLADSEFDAIVSLDTLEHVEHDDRAAAEMFRVLKPGGLLVLNVPAYQWLWGPHDVALMHYRRYTRGHLAKVLKTAGFEVERLSYGIFLLFPAVVAIRLRDRLTRRKAEVDLPRVPDWMNRALTSLQEAETGLMFGVPLPWGSSVVAVARKPKA